MTSARYDGAAFAPATRTRAHGALRRALDRVVSARQASRAGNGHALSHDDAMLATFGRQREEFELAHRPLYPL
jgi:hypothetical protein